MLSDASRRTTPKGRLVLYGVAVASVMFLRLYIVSIIFELIMILYLLDENTHFVDPSVGNRSWCHRNRREDVLCAG